MLTYADRTGPMQEDVVAKGNSMRDFVQQRVKEMPPPNMCVREKHAERGGEGRERRGGKKDRQTETKMKCRLQTFVCERTGKRDTRERRGRERERSGREGERERERERNAAAQTLCASKRIREG